MDQFMNAAKLASSDFNDEQTYSGIVKCTNAELNARTEWVKNHWIDKIIKDFRTKEFIGFVLNDGTVYSVIGLTTLLMSESTGHITVRGNQELIFSVGINRKENSKYAVLQRRASDKQLTKLNDIFVDGYNSNVTIGCPDGLILNVT